MSETIRSYELGFLLVPTMPETEVDQAVKTLTDMIAAVSGEVTYTGAPEFIDLAYKMERSIGSKKFKYSQGYFGWLKFKASPEALESLKKTLDASTDVVRYLLIKTSEANNVIFKKPKIEAKRDNVMLDEELLSDDTLDDSDLKEDHELLPDVQSDIIVEQQASEEAETE